MIGSTKRSLSSLALESNCGARLPHLHAQCDWQFDATSNRTDRKSINERHWNIDPREVSGGQTLNDGHRNKRPNTEIKNA